MTKKSNARRRVSVKPSAADTIRGLEYRLSIITGTSAIQERSIFALRAALAALRAALAKERAQHATIVAQLSRELARHAEAATSKHRNDAAHWERAS